MKKIFRKLSKQQWILILCAFIILLMITNHLILKSIEKIKGPLSLSPDQPRNVFSSIIKKPRQEVIRRTHLDPNRIYSESIFFVDGKEIARYKNVGEKIYDEKRGNSDHETVRNSNWGGYEKGNNFNSCFSNGISPGCSLTFFSQSLRRWG